MMKLRKIESKSDFVHKCDEDNIQNCNWSVKKREYLEDLEKDA